MDDASDVSDEDMQARQGAFRQRQRPENEAPVSVALDAVLLEGPDRRTETPEKVNRC